MSLSDIPGEVAFQAGPSIAPSLLGKLATRMAKTLVSDVAQYEPVHLVRLKLTGAHKGDMVYLHSRFASWEAHPASGGVMSGLTEKGTSWFEGMLTSPSIGVTTLGEQGIFGVASAANPVARNQSSPIPADGGVAIAKDLGLPLIADTCYTVVANGKETTTLKERITGMAYVYQRTESNSVFWDATMKPMFDKARAFGERLGYAESHPAFEWYVNTGMDHGDSTTSAPAKNLYSSGMFAGLKHGWKPLLISTSGSTLMILVPDDGSGKFQVATCKRLTDVGNTSSANFSIREFSDPRYSQSLSVFDSNNAMSVALAYLRANYFVDAKSAVDAFGLVPSGYNQPSLIKMETVNTDVQRPPFSQATIKYFTGLRQAYLLPLIAPPGEGEYFARFLLDQLSISRSVIQQSYVDPQESASAFSGDPTDESWSLAAVKETVIDIGVTQMLAGVSSDWYLAYIEKGYGYFTPKSQAEVSEARALVASYEGLVLTSCAYATPFMLPQDIVEQLQIYRLYKKSRDKACLSNDFMKLEMANGVKWGTANSICNGSRSTSILYGYKELGGSSIRLAPTTGDASAMTYTLKGVASGTSTVLTRSGVEPGDVSVGDGDLVVGDIAMGAKLVGITLAALCTAWGLDNKIVTTESAALKADASHIGSYGGSNGRGYGLAPYDFAWENIGVSGYPLYFDLPRDDAYKMAVVSKAQIGKKTEKLRTAYLGFATSSIVANFLRE